MTASVTAGGKGLVPQRGYLAVVFVVILGFVGATAAMQVLVLTSVAATSRAYDSFRQRSTNLARVERILTEAVLDQVQVSLADRVTDSGDAIDARLREVVLTGATMTRAGATPELAAPVIFPDSAAAPDPLQTITPDRLSSLPPELAALAGARAAVYPEVEYEFTATQEVLNQRRSETVWARATVLAVPLTRFPVAAYELPHEIGTSAGVVRSVATDQPFGLMPARDAAFRLDLQSSPGVLPYHYRRRATLAAAYQYVFSNAFITRLVEYAGVTHFVDLAGATPLPQLDGLTVSGTAAEWDLARAGTGRLSGVELARDAAVIVAEQSGCRVRLHDSGGASSSPAMFVLLLGPSDPARGPLAVRLESISRPVVVVGCNVAVELAPGMAVDGALLLDPASTLVATGPVSLGHLSYWAGATNVSSGQVRTRSLPPAAELIAPRVVYCATRAFRR